MDQQEGIPDSGEILDGEDLNAGDEEPTPAETCEPTAGLSGWMRLIVGVVVLAVLVALVGPELFSEARRTRSGMPSVVLTAASTGIAHKTDDLTGGFTDGLVLYQERQFDQAWLALRSVPSYEAAVAARPAIADAEAAVADDPDAKETHFRLGTQWAQAQLYEPAEVAFKQALTMDDRYVDAYSNLGVVYYQTNRLADAVAQYDRALEISPNDADVHHNRGAAYIQQAVQQSVVDRTLLDKGLAEFERAVELDPALGKAFFSMGVVYFQVLGEKEKALPMFRKFLELDDGSEPQATQMARQYVQQLVP